MCNKSYHFIITISSDFVAINKLQLLNKYTWTVGGYILEGGAKGE